MAYKIPLFDLNYGEEEAAAVLETLRSKWISMGPNVNEFERAFANHLGIDHSVALASCTGALHLAMTILNVGPEDEVIVPSLTFVATVNAVLYRSARPVFADIVSHQDFSVDPADIERKITPKTKAIVVMHYGGFSCPMDEIMAIAHQKGVYVIEDAAHAPASLYKGQPLGTIGHMGCFSFFSNKNISCAEGGLLVTREKAHAEKARRLRSHGMTTLSYERAKGYATRYDVVELGYNYRMDDIRGALLLSQFKRLKSDILKRERLRRAYLNALKEMEGVLIPYENHEYQSSNYVFPVVLKKGDAYKRDEVRRIMADHGIETSVHYPAVHLFSIYEPYRQPLPVTEYVTNNEITLPLFPKMTSDDIEFIVHVLKKAV